MEENHRTFLNLVLKGKLREDVQFVCDSEKGGDLKSNKLAADRTGTINKTVTLVLEIKHPIKIFLFCATLETYEETPMFIPISIIEESVESLAQFFEELRPSRHVL